ncbi:MAG: undecaprenyl-diphosphatase [Baekduia sp.]|jgi:undecaprenyl-diphosphatase|nr:Undecaprenyl-diphosphatase [Conexibacter sp.]MDX6716777.1 undecaprenyl-diphosphatase [Baekduia sp.]MDX6732203.1 undecaprenyl-diphosphatase [Baekduia sp.]
MDLWQAVVLGVVEGLTEFLPVSSTGHLTITEKLMGLSIDDKHITAFTAVIQMGAIVAVLLYFFQDIISLLRAGFWGVRSPKRRGTKEWRLACAVVVGSIPIGIVGLVLKDFITGPLRSLWVVGIALIAWSAVMVYAERRHRATRHEDDITVRDAIFVGLFQCIALIPGVSRSGATISAGLMRDLDRVTATRFAFFLSIPALTAAGLLELKDSLHGGVGLGPTLIGTVVAFVVAYASIAWLLRFVAHHSIAKFVPYRVALGVVVLGVLAITGSS